jgi:hypothetical protein
MRKVFHYAFPILLVGAPAFGTPSPATAQLPFFGAARAIEGTFDRTLNVSGTVSLDVTTGSGSITIRRGANNRVEVHGRIRGGGDNWFRSSRDTEEAVRRLEANPPIEQSGQNIRIGRLNNWDTSERNVSISYDIVVPAQTNVRSHSGSGSQNVDGIDGTVDVGTGSGSITLRDIRGDLEAGAGSGSITATQVRGGLRMHTGSGSIRVTGEQTGRWDFEAGSGGIEIDLPANASFDLSAHTGSGGVDVGFPMTVQGRIGSNRHDISGKVGSGAYPLSARTGSGHIRIQ